MSKDHDHDDAGHGTHTIRASKGGGGGKLLLGALAAVLLAGGGYYAWQTYGQPNSAQTAYNDSYTTDSYDDSLRAGPVESSTSDDLAENTAAEPASSAAPPATRRTQPRSEPVPEATFGVTPASVSEEETVAANDQDDIVVTAAPRPIWVRTPSERRLSSLYPARALERGREGEARLACTVQNGGALDCASVESTPGFSTAAIRVSRTLRHAAQRSDGSDATGTPVNLRVVFRIDEDTRRG